MRARDDRTIARIESTDPAEPGAPWWTYRRNLSRPEPAEAAAVAASEVVVAGAEVGEGAAVVGAPDGPGSDPPVGPEPTAAAGAPAVGTAAAGAFAPAALAVGALVFLAVVNRVAPVPMLGRLLMVVAAVAGTIAAGQFVVRRHPEETWLPSLLLAAMGLKLVACVARYQTLVDAYGEVGDATVYDKIGRRLVAAWEGTGPAPPLDDLRKSNFVRWFTGVVYYLFGSDMVTGFLVFGVIAFAGCYLWYRAANEAVPMLEHRLFFVLVMFAPSIMFWPSSIGKEALMQFGLGSVSLGVAHLFNNRLARGLIAGFPGAWLVWVVRPHLLGLVVPAAVIAYALGRTRTRHDPTLKPSIVKPIGLVVLVFVAVFAVTQGAKSLGLPSLSLTSINAELEATAESTGQGASAFDSGDASVSPVGLPRGMVTVLLRPFPWEVSSGLQILAALEGVALVGFMVYRRQSLLRSLRELRTTPFVLYCWTLVLVYSLMFQAFANFGLLVRQRSLVLPALYVLLCLESHREERRLPELVSATAGTTAIR